MKEQEWKFDRDPEYPLAIGPWDNEPDKKQWLDPKTGYPCLIVRGPMGALCGYVGVGKDHPCFEKECDEVNVSVHGGLTFADRCQESGAICHIVERGEDDKVWWLGFDCLHLGDLSPGMEYIRQRPEYEQFRHMGERDSYKDIGYVTNECRSLALQLKEIE